MFRSLHSWTKKYTCLFLHYTRVLITDNNATLEQEFRQQQQDN